MTIRIVLSAAALCCLFASAGWADLGSDYGYGPTSASLAGNAVAWDFNGYTAYNNPAGLPLIDRSGSIFKNARFILSYGIVYMDPEFTPINNVVTGNTYWGNSGSVTTGSVDTSYKSVFGQEIGMAYRLNPEWHNLTVGITLFSPLSQLAYLDSGETYEPEYILYRANAQQPDLSLAAGMELVPHFRIGVGLHVTYNLTSVASGTIQAANPSTERFSSDVKPKASPYIGFHLSSDDDTSRTLGLVVRLPASEDSTINVNTGAQPIGSFPAIPVAFFANDTLVYQPLSVQLGGSIKPSKKTRSYFQLDYEHWSAYKAPYLMIVQPCVGVGCGVTIESGPQLDVHYRDIVIPRVAEEIDLTKKEQLRLGYGFRPGIISDPTGGIGNYLDPSRHLFNVGMGFEFDRFFGYRKTWNLDVSVDYQQLVTQHVTKSPGDESGDTSSEKIGAPGYDAGGHVIGGQVALSIGI